MSPQVQSPVPQAIIRIVPKGGNKTPAQLVAQCEYLTRHWKLELKRSERYFEEVEPVRKHEIGQIARDWADFAGVYPPLVRRDGTRREFTTHIIASLPPDTDHVRAEAALNAWAYEMFGSGRNGGQWDYFRVFHTDKDHPHLHLVVNRMSHEGRWLKISRRHPFMSYDNMRAVMADVAFRHGIQLDYTTREERGIIERPVTFAEYRRRVRAGIAMEPEPEPDTAPEDSPVLKANPGKIAAAREAAQLAIQAMEARLRSREIAAAAAARARAASLEARDEHEHADGADAAYEPDEDAAYPDNRPGEERAVFAPGGPHFPARNNVETRAQRARRLAEEAANVARRRGRGRAPAEPGVQTRAQRARQAAQDAALQRVEAAAMRRQRRAEGRQQTEPNVETRSRYQARREQESITLRSGRRVDHGVSSAERTGRTERSRDRPDNRNR